MHTTWQPFQNCFGNHSKYILHQHLLSQILKKATHILIFTLEKDY